MLCLSRYDLEQIADRVLTAYRKLPELTGKRVCSISPNLMLKLLKLKLDHRCLSEDGTILGLTSSAAFSIELFGHDDAGEQYYELDGKTVLVDKKLQKDKSQRGRYNFTVMHEAGHHILWMLFPREYELCAPRIHYHRDDGWRTPVTDWEEWQANALASALLMPEDLLQQGMYLCGLGDQLPVLNRKYYAREYERFVNLSQLLGVSKTALVIRMKQLGLLKEEYLRDPDSMLEVVKEAWEI